MSLANACCLVSVIYIFVCTRNYLQSVTINIIDIIVKKRKIRRKHSMDSTIKKKKKNPKNFERDLGKCHLFQVGDHFQRDWKIIIFTQSNVLLAQQ